MRDLNSGRRILFSVGRVVENEADVIEMLRRGWARLLQVPSFIEFCMVTALDHTGVQIEIHDVVIGRRVAEKDSLEIVLI